MIVDVLHRPDGITVASPRGRVDLQTASDVKRQLVGLIAEGHHRLIVCLRDTTFIDSSGLGALIGALKAARQVDGDLRIAEPLQQAQIILDLTSLNRVLYPHTSLEEAIDSYQQSAR